MGHRCRFATRLRRQPEPKVTFAWRAHTLFLNSPQTPSRPVANGQPGISLSAIKALQFPQCHHSIFAASGNAKNIAAGNRMAHFPCSTILAEFVLFLRSPRANPAGCVTIYAQSKLLRYFL